ncbi:MAG: hypothetical protein RIQ33_2507 [Bacteroidota bacterium]
MKKNKEIDVDFIGTNEGLTKTEELAISEFLKSRKQISQKKRNSNINLKKVA